ncbi:hypothetical protein [Komagataeibacter xylinus]|uniref:hypothetical protein n=1 Tax=Komagataeibacter xylinus TaxID=28448 RepID=UPI00280B4A42|nr:hypothetical protein [Komagataeibacter xylinus]
MDYIIPIATVLVFGGLLGGAYYVSRLSAKAQTAKDDSTQVAEANAVTRTETAMAQAEADAPATDAAIDARLAAGGL